MTEVQRLAKIMVLKDMRKEYELRAKYNGGVDYDCYRALDMAIKALEQEPCTQEKQANADNIDAVYIEGFKAGYAQARFDLEQEPCGDAISRQAVLDKKVYTETSDGWTGWTVDVNDIKELPSVTPAEKVGEWMYGESFETGRDGWFCSKCGHFEFWDYSLDMESARRNLPNICPDCGAKMQEVTG